MWKFLAVPFIFALIITLTASFGLNVYYYTTAISVSNQLDQAPWWWYEDAGYRNRSTSFLTYLELEGASQKAAVLVDYLEKTPPSDSISDGQSNSGSNGP
jgi:hypothetical protein